jgi:hypothetical protein
MAESIAELPRGFLLTLANLSAIDHYIVIVGNTINTNRPEIKRFETHNHLHGAKSNLKLMNEKRRYDYMVYSWSEAGRLRTLETLDTTATRCS